MGNDHVTNGDLPWSAGDQRKYQSNSPNLTQNGKQNSSKCTLK